MVTGSEVGLHGKTREMQFPAIGEKKNNKTTKTQLELELIRIVVNKKSCRYVNHKRKTRDNVSS